MAGPVARDRRRQRPSSVERTASIGRRPSLAETTPFVRESAPALAEPVGQPFGPYLVYEQLGEGGMACVHRAELVGEGGLRKPVALKRLHTASAEDPDLVASFVHEAQLAAKLRHPNIAQAYDLGKIDNTYYIAMELVPGPTLAQVMQQAANGAGAVPLPIALEILIQLCDALDHAHELRDNTGRPLDLVHRDVSPMNVIISRSGIVKLIDFGIAKVRSARRDTETGIIKGKHAYVAPEYTYGQLDRRADLFGLGVVAHELLTGRRLFLGETDVETIRNIRELNVAPPSRYSADISPQLDAIVLKALERDPDRRWQTAGAMRTALTEERHRLGVAVTGRQIRDWAEWAFQQTPRRPTSIDRMLSSLDPSLSVSIEIECPPANHEHPSERRKATLRGHTAPLTSTSMVTALADTLVANAALLTLPTNDAVSSSVVTALAPRVDDEVDSGEVVTALAPRVDAGADSVAFDSAIVTARHPSAAIAAPMPAARSAPVVAPMPAARSAPVVAPLAVAKSAPVAAPMAVAKSAPVVAPLAAGKSAPVVAPFAAAKSAPVVAPYVVATSAPVVAPMPSARSAPAVAPMPSARSAPVVAPMPSARSAPVVAPLAVAKSAPVVAPFAPAKSAPFVAPLAVAKSAPVVAPMPAARSAPVVAPLAVAKSAPVVAPFANHALAPIARRRAPAWRPPTRWAHPPKRRSLAPLVLLALIGLAAWLVYAGWIDVERWREIIATYVG